MRTPRLGIGLLLCAGFSLSCRGEQPTGQPTAEPTLGRLAAAEPDADRIVEVVAGSESLHSG